MKFKAWPGRFGADGDGARGSLCSGQVLGPPGQRVFCGSAEGAPGATGLVGDSGERGERRDEKQDVCAAREREQGGWERAVRRLWVCAPSQA